jgi:hypothetical protein
VNSKLPGFIFLTVTLAILCGCTTYEPVRSEQAAFKGMELYSWQDDDGRWLFSIMLGTNRIKTLSEIKASPIGIAEVKQQFCQLAGGEQVFWMENAQDPATGESYTSPQVSSSIIDEIQAQAESCGISLYR